MQWVERNLFIRNPFWFKVNRSHLVPPVEIFFSKKFPPAVARWTGHLRCRESYFFAVRRCQCQQPAEEEQWLLWFRIYWLKKPIFHRFFPPPFFRRRTRRRGCVFCSPVSWRPPSRRQKRKLSPSWCQTGEWKSKSPGGRKFSPGWWKTISRSIRFGSLKKWPGSALRSWSGWRSWQSKVKKISFPPQNPSRWKPAVSGKERKGEAVTLLAGHSVPQDKFWRQMTFFGLGERRRRVMKKQRWAPESNFSRFYIND